MLATLGGFLALLLGLLLLLLPLLASELSRARDSVWGAVVLLLGLVLVTSAERLTGAPMLAVLCGGLLIGRLGVEVGQGRWRLLSEEERQRLWSVERWQTSLSQLGASLGRLLQLASGVVAGLGSWLAERRAARPASTKRWVRPEAEAAPAEVAPAGIETPAVTVDDPPVVSGFEAIDALLEQAAPEVLPEPATSVEGEGLGEAG
ncbi:MULTISPECIES: Ycf66 family protein [unclassified Cyanobium]|uniref:Ycf66 family protein n=1 Tax=unclassified Cyanobium TaxID=2627006 RepID=UPI0020CFDF89|nr:MULTISPECIES: Ycf66 family protein [unclassified Cyanobium]MCP9860162.1 hypothetical protein [Cyanobium sp. Cruz-8H5]MCP9867412.1 hypothetical protein [Cyanobium sp. Cruz-8D1]